MIQKYHFTLSPFPAYHICTQVNFDIVYLKTYCKDVIFKGFFDYLLFCFHLGMSFFSEAPPWMAVKELIQCLMKPLGGQ